MLSGEILQIFSAVRRHTSRAWEGEVGKPLEKEMNLHNKQMYARYVPTSIRSEQQLPFLYHFSISNDQTDSGFTIKKKLIVMT